MKKALLLLFSAGSLACLITAREDSIVFVLSFGLLVVCAMRWLVLLRRRLWKKCYPEGGRWMTSVTALLYSSLFIIYIVTGTFLIVTRNANRADGMGRLDHFFGFLVVVGVSWSLSHILAGAAFVIQLWRDRWRPKLTMVAAAHLLLLLLAYAWLNSPRIKTL